MEREQLEKFITAAENLTGKLLRTADQLDEHNKNVHIASAFGSTIGIIGAGMAITGAILIPFTLGAGAIVGIVGAAIGATGGATAGGAKLARNFIKKFKLDELSKEWKSFQDTFNITNEMLVGDASFYRDALAGATTAGTVASLGTAIAEVAPSIGSGAVNVAGNTARLAAIATSPLLIVNVLLLPLNIYELVTASVQLYKGQGCDAGLVFRRVANVLQKLIDEAKKELETLKENRSNVLKYL